MKKLYHIALIAFAFALPIGAFAEDSPAETQKPEVKQEVKIPVKERALAFILEKAETYSGKIETAVGKAVDYAYTEVPLIIQEFLRWRMARSITYVVIYGVLTFLVIRFPIKWKWFTEDLADETGGASVAGAVFSCIGSLIFFCLTISHFLTVIQIWIAPRVYLIEQVTNLIKSR